MARAESITFEEFRTRFSTEESCWAELFRLRFPNGFVCLKCGCTEYYPVRGRSDAQWQTWSRDGQGEDRCGAVKNGKWRGFVRADARC